MDGLIDPRAEPSIAPFNRLLPFHLDRYYHHLSRQRLRPGSDPPDPRRAPGRARPSALPTSLAVSSRPTPCPTSRAPSQSTPPPRTAFSPTTNGRSGQPAKGAATWSLGAFVLSEAPDGSAPYRPDKATETFRRVVRRAGLPGTVFTTFGTSRHPDDRRRPGPTHSRRPSRPPPTLDHPQHLRRLHPRTRRRGS